ncbi:hypothetical protein ACN42_g10430 [Penicillium freii]|uniref:Uncharacterized protein n=1 Tax=Penicillium freii TaxID=48697 RepID=A0A101MA39_PENFR|nr:hypothetical protein ACN42_g10430 [Penicillium freii]
MRSSTSGQPPGQPQGQAPRSTKRRKIVPAVDPDVFETIISFQDMLADMNSNDPNVRSLAVQRLTVLSPLMQQLALSKKTAGVHYAAGRFKSLDEACTVLQVTHNPQEHIWDRQDIDHVPSASLSADVDTIIQRLQSSHYHRIDRSETSVRVVVELLILDRLHHLSDKGALEHLQLYPEVDVDLLLGDTHVTGRADWLLCHDDPQYSIDATLIAIEAKRSCEFSSADSQMATYLAAVQASRAKIQKIHAIAFGITTDSNAYRFWFIDSERRLFSSVVFEWRLHKAKIIAWIDKMLAEAIEASPLTTPTLRRNVSLRNWEKDSELESDDSPLTEGLPFDISVPDSCHLVAPAWYQGRKVMVVEYEEEEEEEEEESGGDDEEDGENRAIAG